MRPSLPSSPALQEDDLATLIKRAQDGSNEAADRVFNRCREPLLAVIRMRICPPLRRLYDSDDFLTDTFEEIFKRHFTDEVLQSPETLWPYLKRIAENKVLDASRKYLSTQRHNIRREVSLEVVTLEEELWASGIAPDEAALLRELVEERLARLVEELPSMLRQIIQLVLQGANGAEIARRLGVEPKRVYRAIHWLKEKIQA
jgi:RNA polymerase sigma factor (sigma-70 family)